MTSTCPNCGLPTESTLTDLRDGWHHAEFICANDHGFSVSWPDGQT